jgi:hypothetical protein
MTDVKTKAAQIWASFDKNEKAGIRFGLFPAATMRMAEAEGFDQKDLCVALMDCAKNDGGMRV